VKSAKLALFICFPATTGRYNCDIDISGKFLYNLEKTFSKQEISLEKANKTFSETTKRHLKL
jgi:hypothetical protein